MNWKKRPIKTVYVTTDLQSPPHTWQQTPAPIDDPEEWFKSTPARTPTLESDVLVPLAQAAITGALLAVLIFPIAYYFSTWQTAAGLAFIVFMLCVLAVWATVISGYYRLLSTTEEILKEAPAPPPVVNQVEIAAADNAPPFNSLLRFNLPQGVTDIDFKMFLKAIADNEPITFENWTGSGKIFSKKNFTAIKANLIRAGYITQRNANAPAQGCDITETGRENIKRYIENGN